MKIGRNSPCPCGSGKKYKKCCLNNELTDSRILNTDCLKTIQSDFDYIKTNAIKIREVIKKYKCIDVAKALFCLNLWRRNRSALAQGLTMNMALSLCESFGAQPIQEYDEFSTLFDELSEYIEVTVKDDYIIDDFGEVFINHAGKSYSVIVGTGHQQVYGAYRYMQTLASITDRNDELTILLEYVNSIIQFTKATNIPNTNVDINYELPTEDFWSSVKELFETPSFWSQVSSVSKIMGYQIGPIEMRHFVRTENETIPLYNSSMLVDYYKLLLNTFTDKEKDMHVTQTLCSLIDDTFNFSPNSPHRVIIKPMVMDKEANEKVISNSLIFAGFSKNSLLIAIKDDEKTQENINLINEMICNEGLCLVEPFYRRDCNGAYGVKVEPNYDVIYAVVDSFTDIASHGTYFEEDSNIFKCTALDALYMIGFSEDLDEFVEFVRYEISDKTGIFSIGGKNSHFFSWKSANRLISSGAIEYGQIMLDYNTTEDFTYDYFLNNLCEFPRGGSGLFVDPLNWKIEDSQLGYKRFIHKGCRGFGGEIKCLGKDCYVFLAHNVELFTELDFTADAETAMRTVDELNERLFNRYADILSEADVLKRKTLQILFVPWQYAMKKHSNTYLADKSRILVYSDAYEGEDSLIIRYSTNPEVLLSSIQKASNRSAENTYFKELMLPLFKWAPDVYEALLEQLNCDSRFKKTVGVFQLEQQYYFSDKSLDTVISAVSFAKARKEIAKTCFEAGIETGEYRGKDATTVIRKMQLSIVRLFESYISKFDMYDLHKKILGYYAVQQNGVIVNIKRYTSFTDLDEDVQREFKQNTMKIREDYRKFCETAKYLLESNLVVEHSNDTRQCDNDDFSFLLAFADWLVVLQDGADTCYYTDFELSVVVDSEYKVEVLLSEESQAVYDDLLFRKYNTADYRIKNDAIDMDYFKKAIDAFSKDVGLDLSMVVSLAEYMQLGIVEDEIATEVYPNVFEIDKTLLESKFNDVLEQSIPEAGVITALIDFLTLNPCSLKTVNGKQHDILPIWEREKRNNRFNVKPIVMIEEKCIFSPVAMNYLLTSWKSGITEWYLPYEIGLTELVSVLKQWKKRYEDEMVQDIARLFQNADFDVVVPEVELMRRFPNDNYPEDLGDYDVIAISKNKREVWIVESKVLQKVGSIFEDQMQQKNFFYQGKYDEKFQKRINYMQENTSKVLKSFGVIGSGYSVVPYMVTNKLFASRYKKIEFPIVTFSEIKQVIENELKVC